MEYHRFPLGPLWTNGFLLWDEKGSAFFVDPGGPVEEVVSFLKEKKLKLQAILLTHGHADHILGVSKLAELCDGVVLVHEDDEKMLSVPAENLSLQMGMDFPGTSAKRTLRDGDELQFGDMHVTVIHTPGHTGGSVCYLVEEAEQKLLLSGDTLFARSIGRTDLPGSHPESIKDSLSRLTGFPDDMNVLPGHGPETTIGMERRENPFWPGGES